VNKKVEKNMKKNEENISESRNLNDLNYQELFDSISKQEVCNSQPDYNTPFQKLLNEEIALENVLNKRNNSNIRLVSFYYLRDMHSEHIYDVCINVEHDTNTVNYVSGGWSISYRQPLFVVFVQALGSVEDMKKKNLKNKEIETLTRKLNDWMP